MPIVKRPFDNSERDALREIGERLYDAAEVAADYSRSIVPVRSGALQSTIRVSGPDIYDDVIEVRSQAGGKATEGDGNIVDYAASIEYRSPYLSPALPLIGDALRNKNTP